MSDLEKVLAANVARRRAALGLTARDVEKRGGVHHQSVLNVENGKGSTIRTLGQLAAGLGCTAVDLLTGPKCMACFDTPPPGFTCNECGAGGAS